MRRGDLWTLTWNGQVEGHVLVAAIKDGFILGWPVTLPGEPSFSPGLLFQDIHGEMLTVWPTKETGLGLHLLGQPLGQLLDVKTIRSIAASLDDGAAPEGVMAPPMQESDVRAEKMLAQMTKHWVSLCFHTGRSSADEIFLDREKVSQLGGNARQISGLLKLTAAQTRSLWDGEVPLQPEAVVVLTEHYNVEEQNLTQTDPAQSWWDRLASPAFKEQVEDACRRRHVSEGDVRSEVVRSAYALAARQDGDSLADQKLRDAIQRTASATFD